MHIEYSDFNGAQDYFDGQGRAEWAELAEIIEAVRPCFQPSRQARIEGTPIFDPKATNLLLKDAARGSGWQTIPMPASLTAFGRDWDSGKGGTVVEWQFSNYPFLANNLIRTDAAHCLGETAKGLRAVEALVVVTKSGVFPASQSSLYYEQGKAQLETAQSIASFRLPVRLVGLGIAPKADRIDAAWATYKDRTSRTVLTTEECEIAVSWTGKSSKYGSAKATFQRV